MDGVTEGLQASDRRLSPHALQIGQICTRRQGLFRAGLQRLRDAVAHGAPCNRTAYYDWKTSQKSRKQLGFVEKHLELFNKEHHSVKINVTQWLSWHAAVVLFVEEILEYSESLSSSPLTNASTSDISALFSVSGSATVPIPMISMSANWAFLEMTHRCLTGFVAIACCVLFFLGDRFSI